jgi:hypothetical protein|tara:strand:- start:314 stop:514 length:201 start_codon:yes stop_codon:yes gene_type:complete
MPRIKDKFVPLARASKEEEEEAKKIFRDPEIKRQMRAQLDSVFGAGGTISQLREQIVEHKKNKKTH